MREETTPTIRRALPEEACSLSELAVAAKRHWGYPEAWLALWRGALSVTPRDIEELELWVAELEAQLVGFYALRRAAAGWELEHLWVHPEAIGRGIGAALFRHAADLAGTETPGAVIGIESDPHAEGFYLRMGARRVSEIVRDWQGLRRVLPWLEYRT